MRKPKPVSYHDVSTIAMVGHNEKRIGKIIHNGAVKEWVSIGWITLRHAEPSDYRTIPEVK